MRGWLLRLATLSLLMIAADARGEIITIVYAAKAVTVVNSPFGLSVPLNTPVNGYFTFDTSTVDADSDPFRGEYPHTKNSAFLAGFLTTRITGSHTAHYEVQTSSNADADDTFRIVDGPRVVGNEGGVMSIDGVPDEDIQLFVAITDDAFGADDDLINPFPFYTFGFLGTPHTFSLKDEHGTMLMQFDSAVAAVCGDVNGVGGVTATDALLTLKASVNARECLPCVCDADHSGKILSSDALRILRFALNAPTTLSCATCL